jgi:hypothetical protein
MKIYWESGGNLHAFSNSALDGGESGWFIPIEIISGAHWIDVLQSRVKLEQRKFSTPVSRLNPGRPARNSHFIDWAASADRTWEGDCYCKGVRKAVCEDENWV